VSLSFHLTACRAFADALEKAGDDDFDDEEF
jgi:hypothetical protein